MICGILFLNSRTSYGLAKNGTIKMFISHDNQILYVKTKKEYQVCNMYAIIDDNHNITKYIGDVGNYDAEYEYLCMICSVNWINNKKINCKNYIKDNISDRYEYHISAYAIDPDNCKDCDDALSIEKIGVDKYKIGIHIADVSAYILPNTDLDKELQKRCESIYLKNPIHMLPLELVELLSLGGNVYKSCFSIFIIFTNNSFLDIQFLRTRVKVSNITYDNASKQLESNNELNMLYNIGKIIYDMQECNDKIYDVHKMVEIYMIMANKYAAEHANNKLFRSHKIKQKIHHHDKSIEDIANILLMERATYTDIANSHEGLKLSKYTHFTSPIRRYADIIVHRMLSDDRYCIDKTQIENINTMHHLYHDSEMHYSFLNKIYDLYYQIEDQTIITNGIIIGIDVDKTNLSIYVPDYDFIIHKPLISKRIEKTVQCQYFDDKIIVENITLHLFQEIKLKLAIILTRKSKLLYQIIDPYMDLLQSTSTASTCL